MAAGASAVLGATQVIRPQVVPFAGAGDYLIEAAYALYLVGAVPAVLAVRRANPGWGRIGTVGSVLYAIAHGLLAIPVGLTLVLADEPPEPVGLLFLPGLALWLAGGVLMGVAAFRRSRPLGVAIPAALPLAMVAGAAGPLVEAALWAFLATGGRRPVR
ncbi:hypothetical protein Aph01nite_51720 [Acrocarpospora phusangensis]|uniref:Uncharacterized protein n=1 Tax=Acrocarpospora phusangensis TaxID=1070424 RepID=A0A919QIK8_9ACTN|nr:hypothetical protein Aph01nite_51720 [Acrocarpospora phusangensis]